MNTEDVLYQTLESCKGRDKLTWSVLADWYEESGNQLMSDVVRWMLVNNKFPIPGSDWQEVENFKQNKREQGRPNSTDFFGRLIKLQVFWCWDAVRNTEHKKRYYFLPCRIAGRMKGYSVVSIVVKRKGVLTIEDLMGHKTLKRFVVSLSIALPRWRKKKDWRGKVEF